jgi:folate-dependent phosphoribosylglycinamide formyltransferase PurN
LEAMKLAPLHDPSEGPLRVAGLMSGSGTNIRKILEHQGRLTALEGRSPYEVVVLFTDNAQSNAVAIGKEYDIPVIVRDLSGFCARHRVSRRDLGAREEFDRQTVLALSPFGVKVAAYGGYMSIATRPLVEAFLGVNVHPADLSIENPDGTRKYVGDHAVRDAIASGEKTVRSSTHIIEPVVDGGRILMISEPVEVVLEPEWDLSDPEDLRKAEVFNQERLKKLGDWVIFPRTLEEMARGKFSRDAQGNLYYAGRPIPKGWRLA